MMIDNLIPAMGILSPKAIFTNLKIVNPLILLSPQTMFDISIRFPYVTRPSVLTKETVFMGYYQNVLYERMFDDEEHPETIWNSIVEFPSTNDFIKFFISHSIAPDCASADITLNGHAGNLFVRSWDHTKHINTRITMT